MPELGVDLGEHGHELALHGHVGLYRDGRATVGANLSHHFIGSQQLLW